jgi:hypothetical protein
MKAKPVLQQLDPGSQTETADSSTLPDMNEALRRRTLTRVPESTLMAAD